MHSLIKSDDELFGLELLIRDTMRRMKTKMCKHFCNLPYKRNHPFEVDSGGPKDRVDTDTIKF